FEDDAQRLREASRNGWRASAAVVVGDGTTDVIEGLELLYLDDQVDTDSRIFRFYLRLLNQVMLDRNDALGYRFLDWRFKPGQRLELHVPVERWESRLVLPVDAVIEEGVEAYVYRRNGDHFDRISVQVEYRDQRSCVIANDGTLFPGDVVAGRGAYQMHLALKNKSGGGVDPHAGHNH
ncbi:MAG TPA: efflux RND transporter periplasmic adaptor subunit, partial [Pirellulaceae bacterium]|nr:efflux RND transporter periplasmic adaptor subunit [Pirellulaceae bacterium]